MKTNVGMILMQKSGFTFACFNFCFQPSFCSIGRKLNPCSSWNSTFLSPKFTLEWWHLCSGKTWGFLGPGEGVVGWEFPAVADGTSSLLVGMAPFRAWGSLLSLDDIGVPGYFVNLPVFLPDYPSYNFSLSSCSLTGAVFRIWAGNYSAFRINRCPPFSSEPSRVTSFSGKEAGQVLLSLVLTLHPSSLTPWACYLYHGIISSSGNHRFLLFYICH